MLCPVCKKEMKDGQALNGLLKCHWDCSDALRNMDPKKALETELNTISARLQSDGIHPHMASYARIMDTSYTSGHKTELCYSSCGQFFNGVGIEEVVSRILNEENLQVGDIRSFYIAKTKHYNPSDFVDDRQIGYLLENMECVAVDNCGESAEDFSYASSEARDELEKLICDWADKHLSCSFWGVEDDVRVDFVITQEMLTF